MWRSWRVLETWDLLLLALWLHLLGSSWFHLLHWWFLLIAGPVISIVVGDALVTWVSLFLLVFWASVRIWGPLSIDCVNRRESIRFLSAWSWRCLSCVFQMRRLLSRKRSMIRWRAIKFDCLFLLGQSGLILVTWPTNGHMRLNYIHHLSKASSWTFAL